APPPPPPPPPQPVTNPSGPAAATNPFAGFDFVGGTVYPSKAQVRIGDANVPVGATEAHVPISLDRPTPNTVVARVLTRNGSGGIYGVEGQHFSRVSTHVIFRPGDPLEQTVRVPLKNMDAGRHFDLIFPEGVAGGATADGRGKITAVEGASATTARTSGFRPSRSFAATGTLAYRLDPKTVRWSDAGGADTWITKLPHGRTQPANAETGLYLDTVLHQSPLPPFGVENDELVIRSQQLLSPILHDGTYWYHGAAMLTGQKMPATQLQYGQYEWEALMPNRRGGWPALWLLPTTGWPPEIDVYEGFGYSSDWNFSRNYAANIHGGTKGKRSFTALMQVNSASVYGVSGFDSSYHRFAVDIAADYITWFVDGKEVYQTVNPFRGTSWFPLMNVAVKHGGDYVGGTGEMRVRSFAVWKAPS
ncbi:family 16 glycosylhydrolase, partial [Erythrobacter sp. NFXS35]|uniref:glycoside hydrolase family 16 protein n=1 Tax=Erythrobacter sp. NFXS35 TaxID=2818436 RepID=UPI0032DE38F2